MQYEKIKFLFELALARECRYIIAPGDVTEHYPYPKMPYGLTQKYIRMFKTYGYLGVDVLTTFGQHDMNQHYGTENTPLWTMEAADALFVLPLNGDHLALGNGVNAYGHAFGYQMPEVHYPALFNILVTHQMVSDQDYWNGYAHYTSAEELLRSLPDFQMVVCGDNHRSFMVRDGERWLFNCGSLMRSTIAQVDHKPYAVIYDTGTNEVVIEPIPIQPADRVFDMSEQAPTTRRGETINPFVQEIRSRRGGVSGMNFIDTLNEKIRRRNPSEEVKQIITEAMGDAHNEY